MSSREREVLPPPVAGENKESTGHCRCLLGGGTMAGEIQQLSDTQSIVIVVLVYSSSDKAT